MLTNDEQTPAEKPKRKASKTEQRGTITCRKCRRSWSAGEEGCGHPAYETFEQR